MCWFLAGFLLLLSLPLLPSFSSLLLILAAVLVAPIQKIPRSINKVLFKSKKNITIKSLFVVLIAFLGILFAGVSTESSDTTPLQPNTSYEDTQTGVVDTGRSDNNDSTILPSTNDNSTIAPDNTTPSSDNAGTLPSEESDSQISDENNSANPETPTETLKFSIHFIDVGQADAALVECDGHYMLIDGGNKADSNVIYSVLKKAGVSKLDIIVGTHAHEDHIGGLPGAYNYTTAEITLCPVKNYDSDAFDDFKKYANQRGGGITVPTVGDTYSLGSATVTILGVNGGNDTNDTSIILMIRYGQTNFLFTGDAECEAEQAVINSGADLSATVLKVGHHGSDTSTSYLFLRNVAPIYAVISVGDDNSYGHPTEDVLSRLRDADVTVFRTDLQGDIYCTSDGVTVSFSVGRNADADTLAPPLTTTPPQNPSAGIDYIGNKSTKKFHYAWCSSVDRMKESNKFYYNGTRDEMIAKGYSPCGNCNP